MAHRLQVGGEDNDVQDGDDGDADPTAVDETGLAGEAALLFVDHLLREPLVKDYSLLGGVSLVGTTRADLDGDFEHDPAL